MNRTDPGPTPNGARLSALEERLGQLETRLALIARALAEVKAVLRKRAGEG